MYLIIDAAAAQQFIMKSLEETKSNEVRENEDYDEQGEYETSSIEAATQMNEKACNDEGSIIWST